MTRHLIHDQLNYSDHPTIFVLVGLPGSGKSTWIERVNNCGDFVVVSSDNEIEEYAKMKGKTYSEVFDEYVKTATSIMETKFLHAVSQSKSIIWDQTNLTVKKRKNILSKVPKFYHAVAVTFIVDYDELNRRLHKRGQEQGKHIPTHVLESMKKSFETPTVLEGFDEIIMV